MKHIIYVVVLLNILVNRNLPGGLGPGTGDGNWNSVKNGAELQ